MFSGDLDDFDLNIGQPADLTCVDTHLGNSASLGFDAAISESCIGGNRGYADGLPEVVGCNGVSQSRDMNYWLRPQPMPERHVFSATDVASLI